MERHFIRLASTVYEIRIREGAREVFAFGEWLPHDTFADRLADAGLWRQVSDLCKAACILKPEEVEEFLRTNPPTN